MDLLTYGYVLDGQGGAKEVKQDSSSIDINETLPIWIHLNASNSGIKEWMLKNIKIPIWIIDELLSNETRPKFRTYDEGMLITLRAMNADIKPQDMVYMHLWFQKNIIISIGQGPVMAIDDIVKEIKEKNGPKDSLDFLIRIIIKINKRIRKIVNTKVDAEVDYMEDTVLKDFKKDTRKRLALIRRKILFLRRYILPQRDMITKMYNDEVFGNKHKASIRDAGDELNRCIEDLEVARDRAILIEEEITNRISEQLNRSMYTMTMVSTIFLPLMFLTGLLGINVSGIPGSDNTKAFLIVCILSAIIAIGEYLFFKRKHFL